eukprot:jgi/Astpho2/5816/fgenesh1_pg.00080_%23_66_t
MSPQDLEHSLLERPGSDFGTAHDVSSEITGTPAATTSQDEASEATGGAAAEGPGADVEPPAATATNAAPAKAVKPPAATATNPPAKAVESPAAMATNAAPAETTEHGAGGVAVAAEEPGPEVEPPAEPSFADVATQTEDVAQAAEPVEAVVEPHKENIVKSQLIFEYRQAKEKALQQNATTMRSRLTEIFMNKHSVQALKDLKTAHAAVTLLVNASPEVARIMEKTAHEAPICALNSNADRYDLIIHIDQWLSIIMGLTYDLLELTSFVVDLRYPFVRDLIESHHGIHAAFAGLSMCCCYPNYHKYDERNDDNRPEDGALGLSPFQGCVNRLKHAKPKNSA